MAECLPHQIGDPEDDGKSKERWMSHVTVETFQFIRFVRKW